ncbi:hypothetical protein KAFR_0E03230 [Kazachstania africana CBS 2517]|uniref:GPI transamidase component PIG-S n=1 Tax=Kazachstania africana (strain ATCC 22294 / BCRC 22015 / CBS 2517 / CECT 1963 / NBRC 1671 / NRRL Y-8276) TaxID=1071382 RepID=H2AVS5_KAZAF|nr:hypothetical protein KAFR_0E03230 [Kazachstania africana CBS 2517]CCF58475.1 hypothetical protein KAFR_0E03230 [Kazachstania africana CBS 2517]
MSTLVIRKLVGISFVVLYVLFGIPLWYKLTTIYRAPLPNAYIESLHSNKFQDIHISIPVYVRSSTYKFPDVHDAIQVQVNHLLNSKKQHIPWSLEILPIVDLPSETDHTNYHLVDLILDQTVGFTIAPDKKETVVYFDDESVVSNDLPYYVAQTLVEHTFSMELDAFAKEDISSNGNNNVAINYSPNIHLSLTLLDGDGTPIDWQIDSTLKAQLTPFRKFFSSMVNFTVDSSVINFNDLNLHSLGNSNTSNWNDLSHIIDLSDLSSMTYYSENVALNLAIVFPGNETNPQGLDFIKGTNNPSDLNDNWQSYTVPQWGVLIINKYPLKPNTVLDEVYLTPIMHKFMADLFYLLGMTTSSSEELLAPYVAIDSFKRVVILQNLAKAVDSLWSLVKLTERFQQMTIPKTVLEDVTKALETRLNIIEILNNVTKGSENDWNEALRLSNELVKFAEEAFFNGEMLQQNFFPQEHKLAVYLPLLGPLSVVVFFGLLTVMKEVEDTLDEKKTK